MRAPYKTFSWQLQQAVGTPDPDAFTGYWLPRYVSVEYESFTFELTDITSGNKRLYFERHLGEYLADDYFISIFRVERAPDVHARGR
jgi:hypothetical protein